MSGLQIWLPNSALAKWRCELCETEFYDGEHGKYVRHVERCTRKHAADLAELSAKRPRDPLAGALDQEALEFQRRRYGS